MSDLSLFTSLDLVILDIDPDGNISVANPTVPDWMAETFGPNWDPNRCELNVDDFSSIGMFMKQTHETFQQDEFKGSERIAFEEDFGGRLILTGQITSAIFEDRLRFVLRRIDDLDEFSRRTIRQARKEALKATSFHEASSFAEPAAFGLLSRDELSGDENTFAAILETTVSVSGNAIIILDGEGNLVSANSPALELIPNISQRSRKGESRFDAVKRILTAATLSPGLVDDVSRRIEEGFEGRLVGVWEFTEPYRHNRKVTIETAQNKKGESLGSVWSFEKGPASLPTGNLREKSDGTEVFDRIIGELTGDFNGILSKIRRNLLRLSVESTISTNLEVESMVEDATRETEKGATLVRHLRGYSGNAKLSRRSFSADSLVVEAIAFYRRNNKVCPKFSFQESGKNWSLIVDPDEMLHLFQDLFENSHRAMDEDGEIRISTRNFVLNDRDLSTRLHCDPGHYVLITISDNGAGMDEETCERAFEPFFTTHDDTGSAGLGLPSARGIIEMHGGRILCTSSPGEGTAVSIYLPRNRNAPSRNSLPGRLGIISGLPTQTKNPDLSAALIVDDDERTLSTLAKAMDSAGLRAITAVNGVDALEKLSQNVEEIKVIILDLAMPEMTGFEAFRRLSKIGDDLPVIVASGFAADAEHFREATGGDAYAILQKPYQLEEMIERVREIMDDSQLALSS